VIQRKIDIFGYQPAKPGVHHFAILSSCEAMARSVLISVYPVLMYRALGDARLVAEVYLAIGILTLVVALFTPFAGRFIPRRFLYTGAALLMLGGSIVGMLGGHFIPLAVGMNQVALVVITICSSAYLMDYIERTQMGRNETARLFYSGAAWTIGPFLGVWLMDAQPLAPFIVSAVAVLVMLGFFWWLRLGDGKVIAKALTPPANPLAYLPRFFRQPLLVAGWTFAVIRSAGWAIYIIYLPIYAQQAGMGAKAGGLSLSVSNFFLFATPLMLRYLNRTSVRTAIITGFTGSGMLFIAAMLAAGQPPLAILLLVFATMFLLLLDVSGGLPFLMSVKPSERREMSAIYATFRDVSGVISPAFARLILAFGPLPAVFGACGAGLLACALVARRLHPRLGRKRLR
jgi:MFS transporter, ACDE family, multidrug resistance protein